MTGHDQTRSEHDDPRFHSVGQPRIRNEGEIGPELDLVVNSLGIPVLPVDMVESEEGRRRDI